MHEEAGVAGTERSGAPQVAQSTLGAPARLLWPNAYPDAYAEVLNYAFWPRGAAGRFWVHGNGDILKSMFPSSASPSIALQDPIESQRSAGRVASGAETTGSASFEAQGAALAGICSLQAAELAMRPIDRIERTLRLSDAQSEALTQLRTAAREEIDH